MADEILIRCPVCLHKHSVEKNISVYKVIVCEKCGRSFEFQNALPDNDSAVNVSNTFDKSKYSVTDEVGLSFWFFSLLLCILTFSFFRDYVIDMNGPSFLKVYIILFLFIWFFSTAIRWFWFESNVVSTIGFILFEGIGIIRFVDAWSQGMRNFEIMVTMMLVGGAILFLRAEHMDNNSSSSSCSSCSGCGGCGGGCGGCGG